MISVPIVFALVSLAILIAGTITNITLPAVALASLALLSVLVRLVLTFRAHQEMLQRSRNEASTDPLTGLGNRRALSAALERRLEDTKPAAMILALFDLDGFKSYNDSFGHAAGDALLVRLATGLAAVLAAPASVYRMGGDEFCALLPGGDDGEALLRAAAAVLSDHGDGFSISASMGSVQLPEETNDIEDALRLADQKMYAHKHGDRRSGAAQQVKRALLSALAQRDPELSDHVNDVAKLAEQTARELGCSAALVQRVRLAAELHDIGKMAIPEAILRKPGALTDQEWALIRQHTVAGERIIASSAALADVAPLVRSSHERWDGGGYPDGLAGDADPAGRTHRHRLRLLPRDDQRPQLPQGDERRSRARRAPRRRRHTIRPRQSCTPSCACTPTHTTTTPPPSSPEHPGRRPPPREPGREGPTALGVQAAASTTAEQARPERQPAWIESGLNCGGDSLVERFESLGANRYIAVTAQYRSWRQPGPIRAVGSGPDLARGPRPKPLLNLIEKTVGFPKLLRVPTVLSE